MNKIYALIKNGELVKTTSEKSFFWNDFTQGDPSLRGKDDLMTHGIYEFRPAEVNPPDGKKLFEITTVVDHENGVVREECSYIDLSEEDKAAKLQQVLSSYELALDNYLDSVAQRYRFQDRRSLALRAGYPGPYQTIALAFAVWMDNCNVLAYQALQEAVTGTRVIPSIDEFLNALPEFQP